MFRPVGAPGVLDVLAEAVVGDDAMDVTEGSVFNLFADLYAEGKEAGPYCLHKKKLLLLCRLAELASLGFIDSKGLFAEDVFTS